jgi:hypothetical protein
VARLAGEGGGLESNLNRWCSQFGHDALTPAEIDALPRVSFLGGRAPVLELHGSFRGMDDVEREGQALLGTARVDPAGSLFVKLVGPEALVARERQNFLDFVASLEVDS